MGGLFAALGIAGSIEQNWGIEVLSVLSINCGAFGKFSEPELIKRIGINHASDTGPSDTT